MRADSRRPESPSSVGRLLLFWDYDTQWGADRSRVAQTAQHWGAQEFENTERLLDVLAQYDVASCFAAVGAAALPGARPYHDPAQIRRIHAAGHEIASHSHRHEWLPALDRVALRQTLRDSKDALEQCIGQRVDCFVPPFNQPYDFIEGLAISLAERREAGRNRTGLRRLCEELAIAGYRTARVFYQPLHRRLLNMLAGCRIEAPGRARTIAGVTCVRLNTLCGFTELTHTVLEQCAAKGGLAIVYAHPHSLTSGGPQDQSLLIPFLRRVWALRAAGRIEVIRPADLREAA
jgi:hypothetical protein